MLAPPPEPLVHLGGGGFGSDTELLVQSLAESLVGTKRLAALTAPGQRLHEQPVGGLVQRVEAEQVPGVLDDVGVAPLAGCRRRQAGEHPDGKAAKSLAFGEHPVVIAGGKASEGDLHTNHTA